MNTAVSAPASRILLAAGHSVTELSYTFHAHGGTPDAAAQLNLDEHRIIKTLIFDNGDPDGQAKAVVALTHGDERISLHKLERLTGIPHLHPSSPELAEHLTGYLVGGISPFGMRLPLPVFIQETLQGMNPLYINAGCRGTVSAISFHSLHLLSPVFGDLRSMASRR